MSAIATVTEIGLAITTAVMLGHTLASLRQLRQRRREAIALATARLDILDLRSALLQCVDVLERSSCESGHCVCGATNFHTCRGPAHMYTDEGDSRKRLALESAKQALDCDLPEWHRWPHGPRP